MWPDLDRSLPSGELRIHAALLRETVRCLDDEPNSDALLAGVEACAERPAAEYDQCTPLAAQIALLGILLLSEFELAPRLSAGGIAAATDRMIDALPGSWVPGARLAEAASRSDDLVPCLTRLLEALPAEPEPVTGRELSGTLSLLRARLAWETQNWYRWADGTDPLPPLRDAVQPAKLLDRITQVWNDQPDAETDPQDLAELTRLWTYRHLTHGDWPAEATRGARPVRHRAGPRSALAAIRTATVRALGRTQVRRAARPLRPLPGRIVAGPTARRRPAAGLRRAGSQAARRRRRVAVRLTGEAASAERPVDRTSIALSAYAGVVRGPARLDWQS